MAVVVWLIVLIACSTQALCKHDPDMSSGLFLFSGLEAVLSYFRNNSDQLAQNILATFESDCFYMSDPVVSSPDDPARKPFIVIDGNYRASRKMAGKRLADFIGGRYINNPAPCLVHYLQQIPAGSLLRRAYFALSLYATDYNVRAQLSTGQAVVLNGCWIDQLTFCLIQTYWNEELPDVTSEVYVWPPDLLRPDLIIFLSLPHDSHRNDQIGNRQPSKSWQGRSLELYRTLQCRYPITIVNHKITADNMYDLIVQNLSSTRNVDIEGRVDDSQYTMHLFSGLEEVLRYLRNNTNPLAQRILTTFEKDCYYKEMPSIPTENTRKPFIVIEGNGHTSRDIVGKGLARMINGRYMVHPASCLVKYLDMMPKGTVLRRAYFILSLYASSYSIMAHLSTNRAVVLNGYYLDQLSFALIQSYPADKMPPVTSEIFQFPGELLPPDLIFYLHLDDELRTINLSPSAGPSWYTRSLQLYQSLQTVHPVVIEKLTGNDCATTEVVFKHVKDRLSATRNVVKQDYGGPSQVLSLFSGLQELLDYFRKNANPISKDILSTFETYCVSKPEPLPESRKPFIVLEGNNRTSKDMIGIRLSKIMDGRYLRHPAPCLRDLTNSLPKSTMLRRAFYILSLYAISFEIQKNLVYNTVFLNGYWLDQLTFALIQSYPFGRLPPVTSPIFKWPEGLMQPDLILYLNYPDELQNQMLNRSHRNWKPRALQLYQQLEKLYNIKIHNLKSDHWKTTDEIYQYLTYNLS